MTNEVHTHAAGLIIRQKEPVNLETPFDQVVDSYLTPTELFYIRSHFLAPRLDAGSYRLHIGGAVRNPLSLSYQQLRELPSETRVATLECAGTAGSFSSRRWQGRSGSSAPWATPSGPACPWRTCSSARPGS